MNGGVRVDGGSVANRPPVNPGVQVVIATGNAACRTARPTSAGLNGFCPSPPNKTLPTATAMNPPAAVIHSGSPGGRVRPYSRPVIVTDQSPTVELFLEMRQKRNSVPTHDPSATARVKAPARPKA